MATVNPDNKTVKISVADDFSRTPGARYRAEGPWSGQEFREDVLGPAFVEATKAGAKLRVNLDGCAGYATSFLEEAFGGLAREHGTKAVLSSLELTAEDEPLLVDEIMRYIREVDEE